MDVSSYKYTEPRKLEELQEVITDPKEALTKINLIKGWLSTFEDMTAHLKDTPNENASRLLFKAETLDRIKRIINE
jgi:hypothetical protein